MTVEEAQGLYNAFTCPETCENVVSEIDKLKLLIQKLSQYGQPPTEASKVEKLESSLKLKKFEIVSVHISLQPPNTTFIALCEMCKNYDKAMFKEPSHSVNSFEKGKSRSKPQYTVEQRKAYAQRMQKQRAGAGSSKRTVKDIDCYKCGQMGHYKRESVRMRRRRIRIRGTRSGRGHGACSSNRQEEKE
jgi:hypothetical protein